LTIATTAGCQDQQTREQAANQPNQTETSQTSTPGSITPLDDGYIVGRIGQEVISVDPREYGSDAIALNKTNQRLATNAPDPIRGGEIIIPAWRPDGTPYTIDETVTFGTEDTVIVPQGYGFHRPDDQTFIYSKVSDGSPTFHVDGTGGHILQPFGGFQMHGNHNDTELLRLTDCIRFGLEHILLHNCHRRQAKGVLTIDGACYNSYLHGVDLDGCKAGHEATARLIQFVNESENGPPGEIRVLPSCTLGGPHSHFAEGIFSDVGVNRFRFGGRLENARSSEAAIVLTGGTLILTDNAELDRCTKGTAKRNHITFDSAWGRILVSDGGDV
jgi:hypothetical protein